MVLKACNYAVSGESEINLVSRIFDKNESKLPFKNQSKILNSTKLSHVMAMIDKVFFTSASEQHVLLGHQPHTIGMLD
jgi:hypothetical protein